MLSSYFLSNIGPASACSHGMLSAMQLCASDISIMQLMSSSKREVAVTLRFKGLMPISLRSLHKVGCLHACIATLSEFSRKKSYSALVSSLD